jgi:hypothetical protein
VPYTHATFNDAITALTARLYGSSLFTSTELGKYIIEALRTWNSYTSFWRNDFVFNLTINTHWYDLTLPATSLRKQTLTDFDILSSINYHLLEPAIAAYPLVWAGSSQFALTDILSAIQRRRDELISITGCHLAVANYPAVPGVIYVTESTIDIRRVAWLPTAGFGYTNRPLRQSDPWAKQSFDANYTTAAPRAPSNYLQSTLPPISFSVDTNALPTTGQYEVVSSSAIATLTTLAAHALGIPDDWVWVIKFGVLADLLSRESNSKDSLRAQYCEMRYREGVALLLTAPSLLALRINNIPTQVDSVRNADDFNPSWQSVSSGAPKSAYIAGLNLLAVSPKPDSSIAYSTTATVVQNAPVPTLGTDAIQLSHEDYDAMLDYAQHLAMLKVGGAEFIATIPLYTRFIQQAMLYNSKLTGLAQFQKSIYDLAQLNEQRQPRYGSITPTEQVNG